MILRFFLLLLIATPACFAGNQLTDGGKNVRLMKSDPPIGCEELGGVNSYITDPNNIELSKTYLRNKGAKLGANYVRWDTISSGTAYRCEEEENDSQERKRKKNR